MEITPELLQLCLEKFRAQQAEKQVYQNYYDGKHDILNDYEFSESRSNIKVVVNWFRMFLRNELAYSLSNPVNYIHKQGIKDIAERIDLDFSTWEKVHNYKLMLNAGIFGHAYELRYLKDVEFKATVLTPLNCFVLEGNDADRTVKLAMHFYKENDLSPDAPEMVDVYLPLKVQHYVIEDEALVLKGESPHPFPNVPVSVVGTNLERKSMLDDIKPLNDSYNTTISNNVNELADFRMAILKVIGTKFENDEDIQTVMKKGAIQLQQGAEIDYLIKNLPDAFANSTLTEIKENIYRQSGHIDTNEKLQSNTSGAALRGRLITLENKCSTIQTMLEQNLKERLKDYFYILRVKENLDYDYRLLKQKFTMNTPTDLLNLADVASKLKDVISLETLYSLFPFVENPALEYQKFLKERDDSMGVQEDLDAIPDDEQEEEVVE
ncbi:phage portal protein [Priestia megaterium]|uniref:phage portal protein n=1 Tax=Priestia megaterium TaxID=1404 RepID=UPI003CC516B9